MELCFERQHVRPILDAALLEAEPLIRERNLSVSVEGAENLPWLICDGMRVGQVVRNLLSNAVKFSPQGGLVRITLGLDEASPDVLRLAILDMGPGIPEGELEAVFDEFVQSSKTLTGAGGTGLGLAICRRIVLAHHGRISARNNKDGGAEMIVELPLSQPSPSAV